MTLFHNKRRFREEAEPGLGLGGLLVGKFCGGLGRGRRSRLGLGFGFAEVGGEILPGGLNHPALHGTALHLGVGLALELGDGVEGARGGSNSLGGAHGETGTVLGAIGIEKYGDRALAEIRRVGLVGRGGFEDYACVFGHHAGHGARTGKDQGGLGIGDDQDVALDHEARDHGDEGPESLVEPLHQAFHFLHDEGTVGHFVLPDEDGEGGEQEERREGMLEFGVHGISVRSVHSTMGVFFSSSSRNSRVSRDSELSSRRVVPMLYNWLTYHPYLLRSWGESAS